jgi:YjjG family noncanonical pyrimidine nucleotidase
LKTYKYILFDLDHTLWDFNKNSAETLVQLYDIYRLGDHKKFTRDDFVEKFSEVNLRLWELYDRNEIDKSKLRLDRFRIIFDELNFAGDELAAKIGDDYLRLCPEKVNLIPNAVEVLEYLRKRYSLYILTNGFSETQYRKLAFSRIEKYFHKMITSEEAGHKKPSPGIFQYALTVIGAESRECIMVGDNIETDIRGAIGSGMDIVFFNPEKLSHSEKVTYEINSLLDLKNIL